MNNPIKQSSPIDSDILAKFSRHARAGLLMTIMGAIIIAMSLVYSAHELTAMQAEKQLLSKELEAAKVEFNNTKAEFSKLQKGIKEARTSFVYVQLGLRQFFVRNYQGAIDFYDQAIATDPANPVLYDLRGYALFRQGKIKESVSSLEKSIAIAPDYVWGHYNLALAYMKAGDSTRAIEQVRLVVTLDPGMRKTISGDGQFSTFKSFKEFRSLIQNG
jgi:tetratricopeptide (TPR) repeat protein